MARSAEKRRTFQVAVERGWCKACGICVAMCPRDALGDRGDGQPTLGAPERCTGCRLCEFMCPDFALRVEGS